jgi:hypothetical protein
MKPDSQIDPPVTGGWLAYCAWARSALADPGPANEDTTTSVKPKLLEGRSLANRE